MHVHLVAGEISGDTHAAGLVAALARLCPDLKVTGLGGPLLSQAHGGVRNWVDRAAVVGLWEVLRQYGFFRAEMRRSIAEVMQRQPQAVILVDYPGFNLRLAKALRDGGYRGRLIFYISPQVWAWKKGRVKTMARLLDLVICLFPFEVELYQRSGLRALFCGHPMLDRVRELPRTQREAGLVGWFPGSRRHEVRRLLPVMLRAAALLRLQEATLRFVIVAPHDGLRREVQQVAEAIGMPEAMNWVEVGNSQEWMQRVEVAAVASGTATLEAACLGLPFVLVYRVHPLTFWIAKLVVKLRWIGMANILVGREVVRELIQSQLTAFSLAAELTALRAEPDRRELCLEGMAEAVAMLGDGQAYERAAQAVMHEVGKGPER